MSKNTTVEDMKARVLDMSELVAEYAKVYEVSKDRAVLDIMKVDSRFQGSFNDNEIAIILGIDRGRVATIIKNATRKLSAPNSAKELKLYVAVDSSEHESDF